MTFNPICEKRNHREEKKYVADKEFWNLVISLEKIFESEHVQAYSYNQFKGDFPGLKAAHESERHYWYERAFKELAIDFAFQPKKHGMSDVRLFDNEDNVFSGYAGNIIKSMLMVRQGKIYFLLTDNVDLSDGWDDDHNYRLSGLELFSLASDPNLDSTAAIIRTAFQKFPLEERVKKALEEEKSDKIFSKSEHRYRIENLSGLYKALTYRPHTDK